MRRMVFSNWNTRLSGTTLQDGDPVAIGGFIVLSRFTVRSCCG